MAAICGILLRRSLIKFVMALCEFWFVIQEPSFKLFLEVVTLLEVGLAVSVVFGAFLFGHCLSDWWRGLIGFLFAFFDFGESGIQFWVGVAHMVAIAGLAGHQGVAEVVEACVYGLSGGC